MKDLPYLRIDVAPGSLAQSIGPALPAGTPILGTWTETSDLFLHESTIDVTGWTKEDFTFFPISTDVQRPASSMGPTEGFLTEWILVAASPIDFDSVAISDINMWNHLPGQLSSTRRFNNIIWGKAWTWTRNTNLLQNFGVAVNTTLFGSGQPTNGNELYVYRVVRLTAPTQPGAVELPAARLLMAGQLKEEEEYAQIMRMRRVYELQQEYDED